MSKTVNVVTGKNGRKRGCSTRKPRSHGSYRAVRKPTSPLVTNAA